MMNKLAKKVAIIFAAAAIAVSGSAFAVSANDGMGIEAITPNVTVQDMTAMKYVVPEIGANVRYAPSTDAKVVKTMATGEKVKVTGKTSNGWYQVITTDSLGGEGAYYISGDLLSDNKPEVKAEENYGYASGITADGQIKTNNAGTPDYVNTAENNATKETYTVNVNGYLALRSDPAFNYDNEIGQLHTGDKVNFKENYGTYWCVYVPATGMLGFVNSNYLV